MLMFVKIDKISDIRRGVDIRNNMWRSQDDPEEMNGGNQGVIMIQLKYTNSKYVVWCKIARI